MKVSFVKMSFPELVLRCFLGFLAGAIFMFVWNTPHPLLMRLDDVVLIMLGFTAAVSIFFLSFLAAHDKIIIRRRGA